MLSMTEIIVTRSRLYPVVARPGPAWRWTYHYRVDGGPLAQYGPGLVSLRRMLAKFYPNARITESWAS